LDIIWNRSGSKNQLKFAPDGYTVKIDDKIIYDNKELKHIIINRILPVIKEGETNK